MPGLFVSYRRDDSQGFAGRLADDLEATLGPEHVFRDVEIPVGSAFGEVLRQAVAQSDALIVVIGRRWAGQTGDGQASRLFDADDWVRVEIEAALANGIWTVPVLVGGATMPAPSSLPESIRALSLVQAAVLDDRRWDADVAELVALLRSRLPSLAGHPPTPPAGTSPSPPSEAARRWMTRMIGAVGRSVGHGLRRILVLLTTAALLYVGLRLFGDAGTLRMLDSLEARLLMGWERLLGYIGRG